MKNNFGLLESDLISIFKIISSQEKVEKAVIFGSLAKGNFKNGSDVDLALKGKNLDFDTLSEISYLLNEETNMPHKFDIANYHSIQEPELIRHIDRVGVEIFNREKEIHFLESSKNL